ncbi:MAG: VCBS repeat-containing protein, partial [Phycisphaerales bacterium]|nr:VCBS repeat-containing protein [Phycisphaerales bacterium]
MKTSETAISMLVVLGIGTALIAQDADTAGHFGFDEMEVVPIGPAAGPVLAEDLDGDGLTDIIVANNYKSRIEIQRQRADASPTDMKSPNRINELPEHWRFERHEIPMSVEVGAITTADLDDDGLKDILVGGRPGTILAFRQTDPGQFELDRRTRVRDLTATRDGFEVVDLLGPDGTEELIALAGGKVRIWPLDGSRLGTPEEFTAGDTPLVAIFAEDVDGDGLRDLVGVAPDDESPIRVWLAARENGEKTLGPQLRFEMPPLREAQMVRLPGSDKSLIAVIERPSKRLVVHELSREGGAATTGEAALEVHGFTDTGQRNRDLVITDINGDDLPDVLTTDREENAVVAWIQGEDRGLGAARRFPTYAAAGQIEAGDVDGDGVSEIFILSEEEGVVGRSQWANDSISFPTAMEISPGHIPVVIHLAELENGPALAVIAKDQRKHVVDIIPLGEDAERQTIDLGSLSRSPNAMLALDADQDGRRDILLFTPDKPMTMLRGTEEGFETLDKDDMGQFGLVQSASSQNTRLHDIDGDGQEELLIADRNYVRAVRYDNSPGDGGSPGWQVIEQLNADRDAKLVSIAGTDSTIVAADQEGRRLLVFEPAGDGWEVVDEIGVRGLVPRAIESGSFSGTTGEENLLLTGTDAF